MKNKYNTKIFLCIDCYNCKIKDNEVYCKMGYFSKVKEGEILLLSPFDFDCYEWDLDD